MKKIYLLFLGVVACFGVKSQVILEENFDYGASIDNLTTVSGGAWVFHSGTSPIVYTNTSLSVSGYGSSGVGGSVLCSSAASEDANITFTAQATGSLYIASLINVSSAGTNGGYFMHTAESGMSSTKWNTRIFAKEVDANTFNFGISTGATPIYGTTAFDYNTTYLIVFKFEVTTGAQTLYILNTAQSNEPTLSELTNAGISNTNLTQLAIRQSNDANSGMVDAQIDGIRLANNWDDAMGMTGGVATDLAFQLFSANCLAPGATFTTEVCATDAVGSVVTSYSSDISIDVAVGSGTLSGTTTATPVNGCATFSGLSLNLEDSYQLSATASGLNAGTSSSFNVSNNCPDALDTLKVMAYNLLFFPLGETFCGGTTTVPDRYDTLRKIVQYAKPDVLMVCELQNSTGADGILSNSLNVDGETKYQKANFILNQSGGSSDLNNMFYYDSQKLTLLSQDEIATDLRDIGVYKCFGNDPELAIHEDTTFIYFYMAHLKAGSTASDSNQRIVEAQAIRAYIDAQPAGINHVFGGDLNLNSSNEEAYQVLTEQGTYDLNDPLNSPGDWSDTPWNFPLLLTQSTRAVGESYDCGSTGGVDDRLDFLLVSDNVISGFNNVSYVANTYKALGNDGNHYNLSINDGANSAVPDSIANALYYMSDHLPVIMDLAIAYPVSANLVVNSTSQSISCFGASDGIIDITVSSGTTPYTYTWNNGAGNVSGQSGLAAGTYMVTVEDATSLTGTTTVTLTEPQSLLVTLTASDDCADDDASVSSFVTGGTGAYTYLWSGSETTASINITASSNYSVTISDANNCSAVKSISATDIVGVSVTDYSVSDVLCNGGSNGFISINSLIGTSPYSYEWSNGRTTSSNPNLTANNYTLTVTDNLGCNDILDVTVSEPTLLIVSTSQTNASSASASDGSITASVSGGISPYTYSWPSHPTETTSQLTGLSMGNYSLIIQDDNGCAEIQNITIIDQSSCNVSVSTTFTEPTCGGLTDGTMQANVVGGTSPYNYNWSNGATTALVTGIGAGSYSISIIDASLCPVVGSVSVTEPATVAPNAGVGDSVAVCGSEFVVSLIDYVSGNSVTNGSWTDVDNSGAVFFGQFSPGLVGGGAYHFNYVVDGGGSCPDDSTQVTVFVVEQPNAGTDDIALACAVATSLDLAEGIGVHGTTGVWTDLSATGALIDSVFNPSTAGIGSYDVIYVVNDAYAVCLNDTAFVTVDVVSSPDAGSSASADLCTDQFAVAPFDYLGGTPDAGGTWTDINMSGAFFFDNFSPSISGEGTFNFLYTVSAIGCFPSMATVTFDVVRAPSAGFGNSIQACEGQTILFDNITGTPEPGGTWNDDDNSGALSNGEVNVDLLTLGNTYNYTYSVLGTLPCADASATISLEKTVCSGIRDNQFASVLLYPNPNKGMFVIELNEQQIGSSLEIINVLGEVVYVSKLNNIINNISLNNQNSGVYLVKVYNENVAISLPFIIK